MLSTVCSAPLTTDAAELAALATSVAVWARPEVAVGIASKRQRLKKGRCEDTLSGNECYYGSSSHPLRLQGCEGLRGLSTVATETGCRAYMAAGSLSLSQRLLAARSMSFWKGALLNRVCVELAQLWSRPRLSCLRRASPRQGGHPIGRAEEIKLALHRLFSRWTVKSGP
jgi:hypothetical protein